MPDQKPHTDELLRRVDAGDASAEGELLDRHRGRLRQMVSVRIDPRLAARIDPSDVVQTTCLEACRDFARFRGTSEAELLAWLRAVLANKVWHTVRDHLRAQKRTVRRELPLDDSGDGGLPLRKAMVAGGSSPSGRAMRDEVEQRMKEFLKTVPADQRKAIQLRYLRGCSIAEVAERLGRSESAVAGLLKRGLKSLRKHMSDVSEKDRDDA